MALAAEPSDRCTYQHSVWSTVEDRALSAPPTDKPRTALESGEIGPLGCTPCEQDQREVALSNGLTVTLCHRVAEPVRRALERALQEGVRLETLQGYRPVLSRGPLDSAGRRTAFSRHGFGLALDVNREHNGLYDDCVVWSPSCRLLQGGHWQSGEDPLSLHADHAVVRALREIGLRWGGEIDGKQKDFMHFSPDGY
jgi:hypothetical protein